MASCFYRHRHRSRSSSRERERHRERDRYRRRHSRSRSRSRDRRRRSRSRSRSREHEHADSRRGRWEEKPSQPVASHVSGLKLYTLNQNCSVDSFSLVSLYVTPHQAPLGTLAKQVYIATCFLRWRLWWRDEGSLSPYSHTHVPILARDLYWDDLSKHLSSPLSLKTAWSSFNPRGGSSSACSALVKNGNCRVLGVATDIVPATPPAPGWCAVISSIKVDVTFSGITAPPTGTPLFNLLIWWALVVCDYWRLLQITGDY